MKDYNSCFLIIKKKSQISIIIVVVLLIVIVGFVFFYFLTLRNGPTETISTDNIKNYVENCLSTQLNKGFLLAMKQAGSIYTTQNGKSRLYSSPNIQLHYSNLIIPYLIKGFSYSQFYSLNHNKKNKTNIFNYPFICNSYISSTGPKYYTTYENPAGNGFGVKYNDSACRKMYQYITPNPATYFYYTYFKSNLKKDLTSYLNKTFMKCINDFSSFKNQYNIKYDSPKYNLIITGNSIIAKLLFPLTITEKGSSSDLKTKINSFSFTIKPLRLKQMISFTNNIISECEKNSSFKPDNIVLNGFKVQVLKNVDDKGNSIYKIIDLKSKIEGKPLQLWFGVRVRPPLLYYFPQQLKILGKYGLINITKNTNWNFKPYFDYIKKCCSPPSNPTDPSLCNNNKYDCSTVLQYYFNSTLLRVNGFSYFNATDLNHYPVKIKTNFTSIKDYSSFVNAQPDEYPSLTYQINASNGFLNSSRLFTILLK